MVKMTDRSLDKDLETLAGNERKALAETRELKTLAVLVGLLIGGVDDKDIAATVDRARGYMLHLEKLTKADAQPAEEVPV